MGGSASPLAFISSPPPLPILLSIHQYEGFLLPCLTTRLRIPPLLPSRCYTSAVEMPKRTMGGRADAGADDMAQEASKRRAKLHMEKPLPTGEVSSRQQGGRDVVDHVQAPAQVSPTPEQVTPLPRHLPPLPCHLPPLPQPVVNVDGDDDEEEEVSPILGNILGFLVQSLIYFWAWLGFLLFFHL